jgi:hypothetical protein
MVRPIILSRYQSGPFPWDTGQRDISGGPLYKIDELLGFIRRSGPDGIRQWTTQCISDVVQLGLDNADLADLVAHGLKTGTWLGSEWCQRNDDRFWAACDAYRFNRREQLPRISRQSDCEYYLKLAISKTGALLLLISFHPSR